MRFALVSLGSFAALTSILTSAFHMRVEPLTAGSNPATKHNKKYRKGGISYCGGDEGIRTLDALANIPHFQCGALDQLCDVSGFFYSSLSDASGVSSSATTAPSVSSTKVFSNSASISRNIGSSLVISKAASSSIATGASL